VRLESLAVADFRNYIELELAPQPGLNVFVGANAQGKSNLLEAIAVLGIGKSFRGARDGEMIRMGVERAVVRGEASIAGAATYVACSLARTGSGTRKRFTRQGRAVSYGQYLGALRVVTFVPSDLQLVGGTPAVRRAFLNTALAQEDVRYYRELFRYQEALRQKNALLRSGTDPDRALLDVYNRTLAESGARVAIARSAFVENLAAEAKRVHERWSSGESLELRYAPNVPFDDAAELAVRAALARRLDEVAAAERVRRTSLAGPHRDDLLLLLDGRPLNAFGSQGQRRTAVLALKVAEYTVMRDAADEAPLLLLDDVLSELDERRAAAFLAGVGDYEQAYVTTTHLPQRLPAPSTLFTVDSARVARA
jgi:DNA replication and repair protein RecF